MAGDRHRDDLWTKGRTGSTVRVHAHFVGYRPRRKHPMPEYGNQIKWHNRQSRPNSARLNCRIRFRAGL